MTISSRQTGAVREFRRILRAQTAAAKREADALAAAKLAAVAIKTQRVKR